MEIIVCALKCEQVALQKHFEGNVKFYNCGVGAKKLDFVKNLNKNDHLINIGVCGGSKIDNIYLCNKIMGDKTYYPDIYISEKFNQKTIKTQNKLANQKTIENNPELLYDQEAAIIFKEAIKYIGPGQMSFLKVVSDDGSNTKEITEDFVMQLIENKIEEISEYIKRHKKFQKEHSELNITKYSKILKATTTMENRLAQQIRYAKIINANIDEFFNNLPQIQNKKDSLKALDKFDDFLIKQTN